MSFLPRPILQDLPLHIKENIARHVDLEARFKLRNCSKEYRKLVDNAPIVYKEVVLQMISDKLRLHASTINFELRWHSPDELSREESLDRFLDVLTLILKNPKAHIEKMIIEDINVSKFKTVLSSLPHKIAAEQLQLDVDLGQEGLLSVLSCFQAGVLKEIDYGDTTNDTAMIQVTELDQWKMCKSVNLGACSLPIEKFFHFESIGVFALDTLSLESMKKVVDNALEKAATFDEWEVLVGDVDPSILRNYGEKSYFDIPNSDQRLKLECYDDEFYLEKVSKVEEDLEEDDEEDDEEESDEEEN